MRAVRGGHAGPVRSVQIFFAFITNRLANAPQVDIIAANRTVRGPIFREHQDVLPCPVSSWGRADPLGITCSLKDKKIMKRIVCPLFVILFLPAPALMSITNDAPASQLPHSSKSMTKRQDGLE